MFYTGFLLIFIQLLQDIPPLETTPLINMDYTAWPIYMATTVYAFEVDTRQSFHSFILLKNLILMKMNDVIVMKTLYNG